MLSAIERFFKYVSFLPSGCWEWQGAKIKGYGCFWDGRRYTRAHRFIYEYLNGAIPAGLESDHLCRNRACVNPKHIEPVTSRENTMRGLSPELLRQQQLSKTHCPQGHPYNTTNTYRYPNGRRDCRICREDASKCWYKKHIKEKK